MSNLLEISRDKLDPADVTIMNLVAQFTIAAKTDRDDRSLPPHISEIFQERAAPTELIQIVLRPVDMGSVQEDQLEQLAVALCERFDAVLGIAKYKKEHPEKYTGSDGRYSSYDDVRHKAVVARNLQRVIDQGGAQELGQIVCEAIPAYCVRIQDEYLNDNRGPILEALAIKNG